MVSLFSYYIGLDLGQARDFSAIAIIEEPVRHGGAWVSPASFASRREYDYARELVREEGRPAKPPLFVRHLERFELGTPYTAVVERVRGFSRTPPLSDKPTVLLVDKTGVGAAVLDAFSHTGINPTAITIHGGSAVSRDPQRPGFRVPKRDLVTVVQILLQTRRLRVAEGLPEAETLRRELLNFRMKIDPRTAHDSYEHWREGDHDDLVLAVAMACWCREWRNRGLDGRYAKEARKMVS